MSRTRLGLLAIPVLGVMTGNAALSLDMYLPAFPAIAADFSVTEAEVQLTMSTFLAGFAVGQLIYGPLSDSFGRKPVILAALAVYGLISAFCALSGSIEHLVWLRGAQGLAGASGSVLGRAVIRDEYEGSALARAMSLLMLVLTAGPMAAPLLGSAVLELWDWRAVFWTLATYAMVWSLLIFALIPETLPRERRLSIRPGAVFGVFLQVLRHRRAMGYVLAVALGFAGMFAYIAATPFIYMKIFGITPQQYALFFAANVAAMALSSLINRRLAGIWSIDRLLSLFLLVLLAAALLLNLSARTGFGGVWGLAVPLFFYVGTLSAIAANGITGTMQSFASGAGTASSVFGVFQFGAGSLAGWAMSLVHDGTPGPMALFILASALLAFAAHRWMARA
ncbi:MAG: Bcr/CflA family drug resistance efflux transporter [Hyphomicrobiales bacterium]|nr:MAG: Bcr/CflA family drug resistance efflux transporter [Hyphomicrobiales bacterium]